MYSTYRDNLDVIKYCHNYILGLIDFHRFYKNIAAVETILRPPFIAIQNVAS